MLKATVVQAMIGAEDYMDVAYGYTFDRNTVFIYFLKGKLVRKVVQHSGQMNERVIDIWESETFDPTYFAGVKRFYKNQTEPKLLELFETFGNPLPVV
mgnify:CR=1 FL=1